MRIYRSIYSLTLVAILFATHIFGHHGFTSIFDMDTVLTFQGTVSRYDWRNPHVYIYVETDLHSRSPLALRDLRHRA